VPVSHDLTSHAAVSAACEAFARDPGAAHGAVAREELHWYHAERRAWLTWRSGAWVGWDAAGAECSLPASEEWTPWKTAFDGARAPFFTWFAGAQTNAAFNECDRHVLAGHGGITA
jgi:acrylyl-CoA reductase (NADPH)/3-hydroxypropionyl-CoA dehydratase/3-hydroxypropionyl-CoA synthetase